MDEKNTTLRELIEQGEELVAQGGSGSGGYNGSLQTEYYSWRLQSLVVLGEFGSPMESSLLEINNNSRSQFFYQESARQILGALKGANALIRKGRIIVDAPTTDHRTKESKKVFVVHGRDDQTKSRVARFLEILGLTPVILHEQSNQGRTIIEKFEQHADVSFAVVLLTPDDVGGLRSGQTTLERRPRQNVIFEMGYFIGRLGRSRVCAITKGEVEIPSDYSGVLYIELDNSEEWQAALGKELRESLPSVF